MAEAAMDYREPEWVAKKLGLDKNTVYKYLQEGWLPGVQLGRKWLISERLLAEHLEHQTRAQTESRRRSLPQTPRLKRAIELAGEYAASRGLDYLGTEHLLIGMLKEGPDNVGTQVLMNLGVDLRKPQELFEAQVPVGKGNVKDTPTLTDRSRNVLRIAQEQAIGFGHEYIGCEQLLLGILLESSGLGHHILKSLGVTYEKTRAEVLQLVKGRD
jgi:excisionase family DNA binding protein